MPINPEGGFETELERDIRMSRKRYANRVYTNANKTLVDQRFRVFHCKRCTSYVLITDADIQAAPRRRTDNAIVFCPEKNLVKLRTKPVYEPVKVRRLKGIETQYIHACADCGLHIAYQSVPHNKVKSTSPVNAFVESASSTPATTASPASAPSFSPSPATANSSQSAPGAGASSGAQSPYVAHVPERHSGMKSRLAADDSSSAAAPPVDDAAVSCGKRGAASTPLGPTIDQPNAAVAVSHAPTAGTSTTVADTLVTASPVAASPQPLNTSEAILKSSAGRACVASKQADKSASDTRSVPLIYLIETAVIFPTKVHQIRLRCRICGFIPRNEIQFEEHKRDRGHWDQESGHFSLQEDNGDTPINPIIVG